MARVASRRGLGVADSDSGADDVRRRGDVNAVAGLADGSRAASIAEAEGLIDNVDVLTLERVGVLGVVRVVPGAGATPGCAAAGGGDGRALGDLSGC